ncbi:MAG: hypothetical protein NVSMB5_24510 [Candidatus Velthaea sp.]
MAVPTGYTQAAAVAMCQLRTNYRNGIPINSDVVALLNAAIEQLGLESEPILLNLSVAITVANTNTLVLPADIFRIRNMTYSTGVRGVVGTTEYEMVELPYDTFIASTDMTVAGSLGGIPTTYTIVSDASNVLTIQLYPLVSNGYVNIFYSARPTLFSSTDGTTLTNIDTAFQEPAILWTCARMCEARQNMNQAKAFDEQFREKLERVHGLVKRRARKNGSNIVRDVTSAESIVPAWVR